MLISYGTTRKGLVRKLNEDCISTRYAPLFIIADGMGGYKGGQVASALAVDVAEKYMQNRSHTAAVTESQIKQAVLATNDAILAEKEKTPDLCGMGTTMVAIYISAANLVWASVGDSRLYLYRDGALTQQTRDHSLVMDLLSKGFITQEELQAHPRRNELTRAVGITKNLTVDTGAAEIKQGDLLLLCSDGLSSCVEDKQIQEVLAAGNCGSESGLKKIVESLMDKVYKAGAKDNVSIILASCIDSGTKAGAGHE